MNWLSAAYRLFSVMDALYLAGNFLYRRSLRYTLATAVVSLLGYLGNFIPGVRTYDAQVAIFMPLCVGGGMLTGGLLLKLLPSLFKSRLLNVAQAADLDLMENYRKWNQDKHLEALWDRVYRFEWELGTALVRLRSHSEECPPELCSDEGLPDDPMERGRIKFLRWGRFALARPQPEPRQRYYLGIDLRFLEDWYNGGYFDPNDVKLYEQQSAALPIERVRDLAGYHLWDVLADLPMKISSKIWFRLITRAVAMRVGEAVICLNRTFHTDYFNAQALLWPEEADEPWVAEMGTNARETLLRERARLLNRVFGSLEEGRRMLDHFLVPLFWAATDLRARFDPEYVDGSLGYDVWSDLKWAGFGNFRPMRFVRLMQQAARDRKQLMDCLESGEFSELDPNPLTKEGREAFRAVRIALHVNWQGLRNKLARWHRAGERCARCREDLLTVFKQAISCRSQFTTYLVALRTHHELCRLHRITYQELLEDLFETCSEVAPWGAKSIELASNERNRYCAEVTAKEVHL